MTQKVRSKDIFKQWTFKLTGFGDTSFGRAKEISERSQAAVKLIKVPILQSLE